MGRVVRGARLVLREELVTSAVALPDGPSSKGMVFYWEVSSSP